MSTNEKLNYSKILSFVPLISNYTGLHIRESELGNLAQKLAIRVKELRLSDLDQYSNFLEAKTLESDQEWQELILLITNTESYFFRDRGQFELLEQQILPELMRRNQASKTLKIWSAGCSTGEEPYSIAMVLEPILSEGWDCTILGTDLNTEALKKAREGLYNSWSFRTLAPSLQAQYFDQYTPYLYRLKEKIRSRVQFQVFNLAQTLQGGGTWLSVEQNFDLIICRNVFIYFQPEAISIALETFAKVLKDDGYLLTGHAELYGQNLAGFHSKIFPGSIIYQRHRQKNSLLLQNYFDQSLTKLPTLSIAPKPPKLETPPPPETKKPPSLWEEAQTLFAQKAYQEAEVKAQEILQQNPQNELAYHLLAEIKANSGEYQQALNYCQKALEINPFSVPIYYILAHIASEQGNLQEAKNLLRKIIYLEPNSIPAYDQLSGIYEKEGNHQRAQKMYRTAIDILRKYPPDYQIPGPGEYQASELISKIERKLS